MSGINDVKKKAKLSIDEMYDNQPVGNLDNQKEMKKETQQTIQPENNPDFQSDGNPYFHTENNKNVQKTFHQNGNMGNGIQENNTSTRSPLFLAKQQTQKTSTYKMTFNLTEDIYKAFNDLYANRMLQGRKTEKSELICEAIQWLIKIEEEQNNN